MFRSYNRFTKQLVASQPFESQTKINEKIVSLSKTYNTWNKLTLKDRKPLLEEISIQLKKNKSNLTELLALETGVSTTVAMKEVQTVIEYSGYVIQKYAEHLSSININTNATKKSLITFNPLGIVYCICENDPPFWQIFKFILPNIAAGNCILIRPPTDSLSISRSIEDMLHEAEIDNVKFVYNNPQDYENILNKDEIRGLGYIGSIDEAKKLGAITGKYIKPSSIEIENRAIMVILEGADIKRAVSHWNTSKVNR